MRNSIYMNIQILKLYAFATLLVLFFGTLSCFGNNNIQLQSLTSSKKIASNRLLKSLRDKNGNLWMCAANGVAKYNRSSITNYNNKSKKHAIYGSRFHSIIELPSGEIVIGSDSCINLFNKQDNSFKRIDFNDNIPRKVVNLEYQKLNNIIVYTSREVFLFNISTKTIVKQKNLKHTT